MVLRFITDFSQSLNFTIRSPIRAVSSKRSTSATPSISDTNLDINRHPPLTVEKIMSNNAAIPLPVLYNLFAVSSVIDKPDAKSLILLTKEYNAEDCIGLKVSDHAFFT